VVGVAEPLRTVVGVARGSTDVATNVSGLAVITGVDAALAVLATTVGAAVPSRPADGSIAHSTASDSNPPMAPVVTNSPRPIVIGGSVCVHTARPISDGWRHARSCAGSGAAGYAPLSGASSSGHSLRSTKRRG
jgi:hypothetical protein